MNEPMQERGLSRGRALPSTIGPRASAARVSTYGRRLRWCARVLLGMAVGAFGLVVPARPAAADPGVVHTPVPVVAFRQPVPVDATVTCSSPACTATLYYRTTTSGLVAAPLAAYTTTPMTMTQVTSSSGVFVMSAHGVVPPSATDTRGVDYLFLVNDGAVSGWSPYQPLPTTSFTVAYHVHVLEPVHLAHAPSAVSYLNEPIRVTAQVTCATGTCAGELGYRVSSFVTSGPGELAGTSTYTKVAMAATVVTDLGSGRQLLEYRAEVPAAMVNTNGVDYYVRATDAYTNAYSPGTTYVGYPVPEDGLNVGFHHVEVLTRPIAVVIPPAYYVRGQSMAVTAEVTSATGFPTVTLLYRAMNHTGLSRAPMTVRQTPVRRPEGTVYTATGAIPGAYTAQGGLMFFAVAVDDGHQTTYNPATVSGYVDSNAGYVVSDQPAPL